MASDAGVAPDWIAWGDLPRWGARAYMGDLIGAVRLGGVRHRIAGLRPHDLTRGQYSGGVIEPAGLGVSRDAPARVVVADWDAAAVDWHAGTVAGFHALQRHGIEVWWLDVEAQVRRRLDVPAQTTDGALVSDQTGAPGRPTSKHLVLSEYARRSAVGEVCTAIKDEAIYLAAWLAQSYPQMASMAPRSVENAIRAGFNKRHPESTKSRTELSKGGI
jgi:hypothetical protein